MVINSIYKGFTNYDKLINFIENKNIGEIKNFKFVKFLGEYYGVGYENPFKQIIIGKNTVWYIDELGYKLNEDSNKVILPYKINGNMWVDFTDELYKGLLEIDSGVELYNIIGNRLLKSENPKNCYFLALANTFCDCFYNKEGFDNYNYSSYKNKELIKKYIFNIKDYNVLEVNPFMCKVKLQLEDKIVVTEYKPIFKLIRRDEREFDVIDGFLVRPIVNERNSILSNKEYNVEEIRALEFCDINIIKKIYDDEEKMIALANNIKIDINKNVIDFLVHNDVNLKKYLSNLERNRVNQVLCMCGECIKYFENPTETMIRVAIEHNPKNIILINNFTFEQFKLIIEEYRECITYVSSMNEGIQKHVLEENVDNIEYFNDCSDELIQEYGILMKTELIKSVDLKQKVEEFKSNHKYINDIEHICRAVDEYKLNQRYKNIFSENKVFRGYETLIINSEEALDSHINFLAKKIKCNKLEIASGYVYKSGLLLIENTIQKLLKSNLDVKIILGDLLINSGSEIDKGTIDYLNKLIINGMSLRTYKRRFYHGKVYIMYGEEFSCVIIGSSNVSRGGFYNNFETNILFIIENDSLKIKEFQNYYEYLWSNSYEIEKLSLEDNIFCANEEDNEIQLADTSIREFDYLRAEKPDCEIVSVNAFIGCIYNSDYTAFYFERYNGLLILESLTYQNAIYIYQGVVNLDVFLK